MPLNRFRILQQAQEGSITIEKAATLLNTTPKAVKITLTQLGNRIPELVIAADDFARQPETRFERAELVRKYADQFGVKPNSLNRLLTRAEIATPLPHKEEMLRAGEAAAKEKWRTHMSAALSVIAGADDPISAAEHTGGSARQVYRWATRLLKAEGLVFGDMKLISPSKRRSLANKLEREFTYVYRKPRT